MHFPRAFVDRSMLPATLRAVARRLRPSGTHETRAAFRAAGRKIHLVGTHETYMRSLHGYAADKSPVARIVRDLPRGAVIFDVGAHIGASVAIAAVSRPDCHIVAFEPNPRSAASLRQNVAENNLKNVEVVEAGVGHKAGEFAIADNGPWSVIGMEGFRCQIVTLDEFADHAPSFVKIDVEGFEPNVLAGARRVLGHRPRIFMEFNPWTLLLQHYDPIVFAGVIWGASEERRWWIEQVGAAAPESAIGFVHDVIVRHGCVVDLEFVPTRDLPALEEMVQQPGHEQKA